MRLTNRIFRGILILSMGLAGSSHSQSMQGHGRILDISTTSLAEGLVVVTIATDSAVDENRWDSELLSDPPRATVRLKRFVNSGVPSPILHDHRVLKSIRYGYHPEFTPAEVHVVLDLASDTIDIARIRTSGKNILIYLVDTLQSQQPSPPATPTPSPTPRPDPTPTPSPTAVPTQKPHPPPTSPPAPVKTPDPRPTATPTVAPKDETPDPVWIAKIVEINVTPRDHRSTTLRITTDIRLPSGSFGAYRVGEAPPRHVVSLIGVHPGDLRAVPRKDDPTLSGIRMETKDGAAGRQTTLVLELKTGDVEVTRLVQSGVDLVLLLESLS